MSAPASAGWAVRLVDLLHRRGRWFIAALVIATVGIGVFAAKIKVDNSLKVWFVEGDPALTAYDHYKEAFGNDEIVIVAVTAPDGGIYQPRYLEKVRTASQALEKLSRVRRVSSLAVSLHATNEDGDIVVGPLLPESGPVSADDAAAVKRRVAADPSFKGVLVGDSDKVSLILIEPKSSPDYEHIRKEILAEIGVIVDRELRNDGLGAHLGGVGVVYEGLNEASLRDSGVFVTLSYLILLGGLWLIFRRVVWVLVGGAIVSIAVIATLGIAGLLGRDMNMVTAIIPTMIMTVGILDLVHLVDAFDEGRAADPKASATRILGSAVAFVVVPCIVNSFTDVIGFASFVVAPVGAIRDLGWLVSAGLLILLVAVLVIGIPALARFGGRKGGATTEQLDNSWVSRGVMAMTRFAIRHKGAVLIATVVGLPLGAAIAVGRFPGRHALIVLLNALMGLPPVVVGLVVYLMLSRAGPLGDLGLLFTPGAMVIAQTVLVLPILAALCRQAVEDFRNQNGISDPLTDIDGMAVFWQ